VTAVTRKYERRLKELELKLRQAGIPETPDKFIRKVLIASFVYTILISVIVAFAFLKYKVGIFFLIPVFPISFFALFSYLLRFPDIKKMKRGKSIEREAVFVGRHLLIELASGISLYDALKGAAKNFRTSGKVFQQIVDNVKMGTSIEDALDEGIERCPSGNLRKILWQVNNSLQTGTDVTKSLSSVVDQISKEQMIDIKRYGRKLNPLAMFYMVLAVVIPSLGITLLIILSTLIKFPVSLQLLLAAAALVGVVQFAFISIIKSSRPPVGI
jgi:pilus assembly protein TadC